ncbi:MAG: protein-L-isoaspartate(D-aspartate) O-methyltransferase [Chloroflexota bacterium]
MQFDHERNAMIRTQLIQRGISDQRVLDAMSVVPRHLFVPTDGRDLAYEDRALPIDQGQTISQPFVVALMAQALRLTGNERVLDVGTGSGYGAAILSQLASEVYSIERHNTLAQFARRRLHDLGYTNVQVLVGDGTSGLPAYAPFDAITVAAAAPWIPRPLRDQLSNNGRMVIPVGGRDEQFLLRLTRRDGAMKVERLRGVRFVPLVGSHAWEKAEW